MVIFGIEFHKDLTNGSNFIDKSKERMIYNDTNKKLFSGSMVWFRSFQDKDKAVAVIDLKPFFPNVSYLGIIATILIIVFKLPWAFIFITTPFSFLSLLYMKEFYFWVFKKGLNKHGYSGKIKLLKTNDLISFLTYRGGQ